MNNNNKIKNIYIMKTKKNLSVQFKKMIQDTYGDQRYVGIDLSQQGREQADRLQQYEELLEAIEQEMQSTNRRYRRLQD